MQKTMLRISGLLFFVISAVNYMRFVGELPVQIGGYELSLNMSLLMAGAFFMMSWATLHFSRK